jgi:CheY-like chemotaxis protein
VAEISENAFIIFLAEDSRADAYLVDLALREHGICFKLITAFDGEDALNTVRNFGRETPFPDMALIDQNMPREDGKAVIQTLREQPNCAEIPVIIMSSADSQREHSLTRRFDAVFFRKPNNLPTFLELGALAKSLLPKREPAS